ncbi:MAG: carboxypeptidase-like regulatory domain-containing protein [Bacteroidota bacterium]
MKIYILFVLLISGLSTQAQDTLRGRVLDAKTSRPLQSAHIKIKSTARGTSTSATGYFELKTGRLPVVLEISHLNYEKQLVAITRHQNTIRVLLRQKTHELSLTEISAEKIKDLVRERPLYVADYALYGDSLMLLTYPYRRIRDASLVLMDINGRILLKQKVNDPEDLYSDKLGNVHLFTSDSTYQLFVSNDKIHLLYPAARQQFREAMQSLSGASGSNYYIKTYRHKNQVLDYYRYDQESRETYHFHNITSEKGVNMLYGDFYWRIQQEGFTEADLRFEEMAFYSPVFAPMVSMQDSVIILNYLNDSIEIFSPAGKKLRGVPIKLHHHRHWEKQIIVDREQNKVYALFSDNGIKYLKKINLNTGMAGERIEIPDFRFVEKIKVNNGMLFFLYRNFLGQKYKKIYRMQI